MNRTDNRSGRETIFMNATQTGPGFLERLADLAYRRRGRMVLAWIAVLAAVVAFAPMVAGEFGVDYSTPGSESKAAADLLADRFPGSSGDTIDVVWQAPAGARAPAVQATMERFLAQASRLEGVGAPDPAQISPDGRTAVARLQLDRPSWDVPNETGTELIAMAEAAGRDGLQVEVGGAIEEEGAPPELMGFLAAALILLVAFGSVVAAGLPLATALVGVGISATLIGVVAAVLDVPDWATAVAGLLGIGVGIDYALLILTRFRAALADGADRRAATVEAVRTAGRSVLVAGTTVVISILGLFLVGVSSLGGVAVAASLAVLVVMVAAVTLLPALLAYAGPRVDRLRIPGLGRGSRHGDGSPAARWSRLVQRRPWPAAVAGTVILLVLAAPALGLRLGFPDAGNNPADSTTRRAYDLLSEGFGPGANGPLFLAADLERPDARAGLTALAGRLREERGVVSVGAPRINAAGNAAILTVVPASSPQDSATSDLVHRLRDDVLPQATAGSGITVFVGGTTAAFVDDSELVSSRLPLFVAGVVGLSLLFILAVFRSPLVALKAGVMNLLSVGAAYGVLALFAEGTWAGGLLGIDTDTPVPSAIPVIMFAILFGLSMDYEVFLLSRVREEFLKHGDTSRAVVDGVAKTARVITAAAAIMVVVFLAFVFSAEVFLKLMGVGMAAAILVDATIVRMVLVPAVMQLLGRATWWIPRWLDRVLPRLDVEPTRPLQEVAPDVKVAA
jgi:RND superfamily putative drug exporter